MFPSFLFPRMQSSTGYSPRHSTRAEVRNSSDESSPHRNHEILFLKDLFECAVVSVQLNYVEVIWLGFYRLVISVIPVIFAVLAFCDIIESLVGIDDKFCCGPSAAFRAPNTAIVDVSAIVPFQP